MSHNHQANDYKFIFICGLHRSGTSVLFRTLREHPEISGFQETGVPEDEGMHLQSIYKPSGDYGGAGKFAFQPESHLTETSPSISAESKLRLFAEWSRHWNLDRPYLLEKSPPNLTKTRFLQKMFKQTFFIVFLRHPIAVSYATRRWYKHYGIYWRKLSTTLEHWLIAHELFEKDRPFLGNVFITRYEDFVSQPNESLEKIYRFLNLQPSPYSQKIFTQVNRKYFSMWSKDLNSFLWKPMTKSIISNYEERVNIFGYSLKEPPTIKQVFLDEN